MSCNCPTPNQCESTETCLCGLNYSILNPQTTVVIESGVMAPNLGEGGIYYVIPATPFHDEFVISYNYILGRWELVSLNEETGNFHVGVLYSTNDNCPISDCWDTQCISIGFIKSDIGVLIEWFVWQGEYANGKKLYTFTNGYFGGTYNYKLYWVTDLSIYNFPGISEPPQGTSGWILEQETTPGVWTPFALSPTDGNCPGDNPYYFDWDDYIYQDSRIEFVNLSGENPFQFQTSAVDCGCCDTEVIVTVNGTEYTASVEYDEYGNILGYNGVNYYTFVVGESTYYLFYLDGQWVVKGALSVSAPTFANLFSNNECPYGAYNVVSFESFSLKGVECFDCCDYYTPPNRNLLKKKKLIFVKEIASIRNKELFGLKCGTDWEDLYKKHLIFDVLWCLPYNSICDEDQQCLINKLSENCNC